MFGRRDERGLHLTDLRGGLRIRKEFFPWGTTLDAAGVAPRGTEDGETPHYQSFDAPCRSAYGFDTAGVTLSAPGLHRPITAASYELTQPSRDPLPDPTLWTEALTQALGQPEEAERHEVPSHSDPSGSVRYYARWELETHSVGLSVYGGPRTERHGVSAGCLWLSWSTLAAAAPFLPEWRARAADLEQRAAAPISLRRFQLGAEQYPATAETTAQGREAHYALNAPDLLPTPSCLNVDAQSFVLWQAGHAWCLSSAWESVLIRSGQTVRRIELLPAKGGGSSQLAAGNWRVHDLVASPAVAAAAKAIAAMPGVRLEQAESYDC